MGSYDCTLPAGLSFCDYQVCPSAGSRPAKLGPSARVDIKAGPHGPKRTSSSSHTHVAQDGGGPHVPLPGRSPLQRARTGKPQYH